jgi:transcription elongation factor GreA
MIMARAPITREGHHQLQKELDNLKKVVRPQVIKAIEEARAHGDLSENAEYDAAKEKQAFTEKKIHEIEQRLAACEIIDACNFPTDKVGFGSVVTLENHNNGGQVTYQIVGPDESDIPSGKISIVSPLGKALLGKEVDDEVAVQTPGGLKNYTVLKIC